MRISIPSPIEYRGDTQGREEMSVANMALPSSEDPDEGSVRGIVHDRR